MYRALEMGTKQQEALLAASHIAGLSVSPASRSLRFHG